MSKLKPSQVREIFRLRNTKGWSLTLLSERFGVSRAQIHNVISGRTKISSAFQRQDPEDILPVNGIKIRAHEAREIHRLREEGMLIRKIASRYGISISYVMKILSGNRRQDALSSKEKR